MRVAVAYLSLPLEMYDTRLCALRTQLKVRLQNKSDIFELFSVCPTHDVKVCPDLFRALAFAGV